MIHIVVNEIDKIMIEILNEVKKIMSIFLLTFLDCDL